MVRESDLSATILLGIMSFVNLILAICMEYARKPLFIGIRTAANITGRYGAVDSYLTVLEGIFWALFILFAIGTILVYLFGSHIDEPETEQFGPEQQFGAGFNQYR